MTAEILRARKFNFEVRHPRCVGFNNKGIFVYYTNSLTQLHYLSIST